MYNCAVTDKSAIHATAIAMTANEISVLRAPESPACRIGTRAVADCRGITRNLRRLQRTLENITEKL